MLYHFLNRATPHTAAHHQQVAAIGGQSQIQFCPLAIISLLKLHPHRNPCPHQFFRRDAAADKIFRQIVIRNKIPVQCVSRTVRTTGIIRSQKTGLPHLGMLLQENFHHKCGKHMGTDHRVILPVPEEAVQPPSPGGEQAVYLGLLPENARVLLCKAVSTPKQEWKMAIDPGMPVGNKPGHSL